MKKALIGVTTDSLYIPPASFGNPNLFEVGENRVTACEAFQDMVFDLGAVPVFLSTGKDFDLSLPIIDKLDGFVITGGRDINPRVYGERILLRTSKFSNRRDDFEARLISYALEKDKPVFGICRGFQMINVCLGGSLYQNLTKEGFPPHDLFNQKRSDPSHKVLVEKPGLIYDLTGKEVGRVNSYHHQGVKKLAKGLIPLAKSEEGLVEAGYLQNKKFVLGVQWHPEYMYKDDFSGKIAEKFIKACEEDL